MNLKLKLSKYYINSRGWKTKRKLVLIESDDWGSRRVHSKDASDCMLKSIPSLALNKFDLYDGFERSLDLEDMFETLNKFKDKNRNPAVITALYLVGNPNLEKIRSANFEYFFEDLQETMMKYSEPKMLDIIRNEGILNGVFYPQFHGREHLFPERYVARLRNLESPERKAIFCSSIIGKQPNDSAFMNYMASFEFRELEDKVLVEERIKDGLQRFERIFGYKSISICPPQSIYGDHIFEVCKNNGVKAIQAGKQFSPTIDGLKKKEHIWGDRTVNGLIFWRRNCTFEPYKDMYIDHIDNCLKEIDIAFKCGKPAVINSHRINFTSRVTDNLKHKTLKELEKLLKAILVKWPDVEFINSEQLFHIINERNI